MVGSMTYETSQGGARMSKALSEMEPRLSALGVMITRSWKNKQKLITIELDETHPKVIAVSEEVKKWCNGRNLDYCKSNNYRCLCSNMYHEITS